MKDRGRSRSRSHSRSRSRTPSPSSHHRKRRKQSSSPGPHSSSSKPHSSSSSSSKHRVHGQSHHSSHHHRSRHNKDKDRHHGETDGHDKRRSASASSSSSSAAHHSKHAYPSHPSSSSHHASSSSRHSSSKSHQVSSPSKYHEKGRRRRSHESEERKAEKSRQRSRSYHRHEKRSRSRDSKTKAYSSSHHSSYHEKRSRSSGDKDRDKKHQKQEERSFGFSASSHAPHLHHTSLSSPPHYATFSFKAPSVVPSPTLISPTMISPPSSSSSSSLFEKTQIISPCTPLVLLPAPSFVVPAISFISPKPVLESSTPTPILSVSSAPSSAPAPAPPLALVSSPDSSSPSSAASTIYHSLPSSQQISEAHLLSPSLPIIPASTVPPPIPPPALTLQLLIASSSSSQSSSIRQGSVSSQSHASERRGASQDSAVSSNLPRSEPSHSPSRVSSAKPMHSPSVPKQPIQEEKQPEVDSDGYLVIKPGDNLTPRYKILKFLGEGTFARVAECWDRNEKKRVAIKVVRAVDKYRESAEIEIDILKDVLRHDPEDRYHCIRLLSSFEYHGHICLSFELMGLSVYDFLRKNKYKPFDAEVVRDFAWQLLQGVAFLHRMHLIHTDLKPENIMMMNSAYDTITSKSGDHVRRPRDSRIRIIDFGSATYEHDYHSSIICTRHYRPLEVILGLGWSYPADVYAIGLILVELATGDAVFQTHENREHLALMEKVFGRLPKDMIARADRDSAKYFDSYLRLRWPDLASSRDSIDFVDEAVSLSEICAHLRDPDFTDLVENMCRYHPNERMTAEQALLHPYFARYRRSDGLARSSSSH